MIDDKPSNTNSQPARSDFANAIKEQANPHKDNRTFSEGRRPEMQIRQEEYYGQ